MKDKHMVFVIQITVAPDMIEFVRASLQEWALRCRGAYAAVIRIDEVKVDD